MHHKDKKDRLIQLSSIDSRLIEKVARRVSDKEDCKILQGPPCTNGTQIFLPFDDRSLDYNDLEGLASHEGAHIRFKSIIDPNLSVEICKENPMLGAILLNISEDFRIDSLLLETFPGFWDELHTLSIKVTKNQLKELISLPLNTSQSPNAMNLLMILIGFRSQGLQDLVFDTRLRTDGKFKFASESMGRFWKDIQNAFNFLEKHRSFMDAVLTAKALYLAIKKYLQENLDNKKEENQEEERKIPPNLEKKIDRDSKNEKNNKLNPYPDPETYEKDKKENEKKSGSTAQQTIEDYVDELYQDRMSGVSSEQIKKEDLKTLEKIKKLIRALQKNFEKRKNDKESHLDEPENKSSTCEPKEIEGASFDKELKYSPPETTDSQTDEKGNESPSSIPESFVTNDEPSSDLDSLFDLFDDLDSCLPPHQRKGLEKDLKSVREEIDNILREIKFFDGFLTKKKKEDTAHINFDKVQGDVKVDLYRDTKIISHLNGVDNAKHIYNNTIQKYHGLIRMLRMKFEPIRKHSSLQRGERRGLVSARDLPQVRASKGKFTRPFKLQRLDKGAQLLILLDESGSMQGIPIMTAKEAGIILAESLKGTRIDFGLIGFSARNRSMTICEKIYKEIHEDIEEAKLGAINISQQYIQNRDGTSFRFAVQNHIHTSQNAPPIVIVISDGIPCHGGTSYVNYTAIDDTSKAIKEIQQMGVKIFALSIDIHGGSYLREIYGANNFFIAHCIDQLPDQLIRLVSQIAKSMMH